MSENYKLLRFINIAETGQKVETSTCGVVILKTHHDFIKEKRLNLSALVRQLLTELQRLDEINFKSLNLERLPISKINKSPK